MDLRYLNYFLVLAEELHFGRAAQRLHISQPPLSRMIRQMEEDLGVLLFERTKRKVILTPAGVELCHEGKQMIAQMASVKKRLNILGSGETGLLRIGYVGATMHSSLPASLAEFAQKYPDIQINFEEQNNEKLVHSLLNSTLDAAFVRTWIQAPTLTEQLIEKEEFVAILPLTHPLVHRPKISLLELKDEPFIMFSRECGPTIFDNFLMACTKTGFTPHIAHIASQFNSVLRLVEGGFGVSLLPKNIHSGYNLRLKCIALEETAEYVPLIMLYRKESSNPSLHLLRESFPIKEK